MSDDIAMNFSRSSSDKIELILLKLQRIQEDVQMAKCQLKAAIRELSSKQSYLDDRLLELNRSFRGIDERLHGFELTQERQNSST